MCSCMCILHRSKLRHSCRQESCARARNRARRGCSQDETGSPSTQNDLTYTHDQSIRRLRCYGQTLTIFLQLDIQNIHTYRNTPLFITQPGLFIVLHRLFITRSETIQNTSKSSKSIEKSESSISIPNYILVSRPAFLSTLPNTPLFIIRPGLFIVLHPLFYQSVRGRLFFFRTLK